MTPVKPKRVPRAIREQQMLDASVEVFARRGYHPAGVEEIAEIAGISKPMVYLYFGSKEELFVACIRREANRLMEMITQLVDPQDPPKEQLWSALRGFFSFVSDHSGAWIVLYRQARTQGGPSAREVDEMRRRTVELIAAMLSQAAGMRKPGEQAVTAAHALVGSCESLADWMLDTPGTSAETTAKRLMHFAWPGLEELMEATRAKRAKR
ncbi:transcriptional regulator, TetR family [Stackebrandtia nassauensis DSM 44728]|uniref:Transcriptional regulator, TetR family n=1 Tax=Stackebrandtia nassauensis (strain DSM 44728 / CIP 108903 / NRRL B-16338 / NBRC 102104 / LLR-40K-21) TaxID=446470 RepID=D3Q9K5_STANL|nr:TetR/AcrR family transcriptional regulator [Stackebrandtia nassauensis]ADD42687.1 transcriptional regulator, TetR family [Stackebrandtia nassauensis DSM 44728]